MARATHTPKAALNLATAGWKIGYQVRIFTPSSAPHIVQFYPTVTAP